MTVDGAIDVSLSHLRITDAPAATVSYGIRLINGATALITESAISGGDGSLETYGIASDGSTPTIIENCGGALDAAGRCDSFCGSTSNPGIRGRVSGGTGVAYAVHLQNSPGALVSANSLCGSSGSIGAGLRVSGPAAGVTVRGNLIAAFGASVAAHGVSLEDCAGDAPWIVDNFLISSAGTAGTTTTEVHGLHAAGDCHPVVDSNLEIRGQGGESQVDEATGLFCGSLSSVASRCTVDGNGLIQGSAVFAPLPLSSVGVRCEAGSCARISENVITGRAGDDAVGLWVVQSGPLIESNRIDGGCGTTTTAGVRAQDAWARLENNGIAGGACSGAATGAFAALDVEVEATSNQLDVHSNVLDGAGDAAACTSSAIELASLSAPVAGGGRFRNNIVLAGSCATAYGLRENDADADPGAIEHNDFDPSGPPTALYRDEAASDLVTAAQVNALTDTSASGNLSAPAGLASYPLTLDLGAGSICIDAGTLLGAPPSDLGGQLRDTMPDIGADEF